MTTIRKLAVAISNKDANNLPMYVGEDQAGKVYYDLTGGIKDGITIDDKGWGAFPVESSTLAAWGEK